MESARGDCVRVVRHEGRCSQRRSNDEANDGAQSTASLAAEELNLGYLRAFVFVAQCGGVTQAAKVLFRAQSAMTRAVQELEKQLDDVLFERVSSGMRLNTVGRCVVFRAQRVLDELASIARWCSERRRAGRRLSEGGVPSYLLNARRLRMMVVLARTRHMPTAARTLGISQPAISAAIRVLEAGAGVRLFDRTSSGMAPTEAGQIIALHAQRALSELKSVRDDIAAHRGVLRGKVVVGALPLGRSQVLPMATARMIESHPEVRICTDESPYEALHDGVRSGDVDFIFGALRTDLEFDDVIQEPILEEGMVVVVGRDHPLASRAGLSLGDLREARWVIPRRGAPARTILDKSFARGGLDSPIVAVETGDLAVIRGILLQSEMIAAVSEGQLRHEILSGEVVALPLDLTGTERVIGLTWRLGAQLSPAAEAMMNEIRSIAGGDTLKRHPLRDRV